MLTEEAALRPLSGRGLFFSKSRQMVSIGSCRGR